MANLIVVGSKECPIWDVTRVLKNTSSFSLVWEKRCEIAHNLGVDAETISRMNLDYLMDKSNTWAISICNLLDAWTGKMGSGAKLEILADILEKNNLQDCAEQLINHFLRKSSFEKRFSRIPNELSRFQGQIEKSVLILFTPDTFITCEKIREIQGSNIVLSFRDYLKSLLCSKSNQLQLVCTNNFEELKKVLKECLKRLARLVIITGIDCENNAQEILDDTCHLAFDKMEWDDLSPIFQYDLETKANDILRKQFNCEFKLDDIADTLFNGHILVDLINNNPLEIFKTNLPPPLPYYIERELTTRNIIREEVFQNKDLPDIFVVVGMERSELSHLVKSSTDNSTSQRVMKVLTVKYIILDRDDHFQQILEKTSGPVHLIKKESDGRFKWIRSVGKVELLQNYIDTRQDNVSECELSLSEMQTFPGPICISDSPGMGKSTLLEEIGRRLAKKRTVIFLTFREFIAKVKENVHHESKRRVMKALMETGCLNELGKFLLQHIITSTKEHCVEVILDGLDEVYSSDTEFAFEFMQIIQLFKTIRLWVSTRPHLLPDLENAMGVPGYNIEPFSEDNQHKFLFSYWIRNQQLHKQRLQYYVDECLKTIRSKLKSKEKSIIGIPLQCYIIGEIFEAEAIDFCHSTTRTVLIAEGGINSISNLYDKLFQRKLQKLTQTYTSKIINEDLINTHVYYSLELLYPEHFNQIDFEKVLSPVNRDLILRFGILETVSLKTRLTFIHQTFAEYFVARFVTNLLKGNLYGIPTETQNKLSKFIYQTVLQTKTYLLTEAHETFTFANQTICHMFNSILAEELENIKLPLQKNHPYYYGNELNSMELIKSIAHACVRDNYLYIYNYFENNLTFQNELMAKQIFVKSVLYSAVKFADLEFAKKVFIAFRTAWELTENRPDSKFQRNEGNNNGLNLNERADILDFAIQRGKYSIMEYVVNEKNMRELLENPAPQTSIQLRLSLSRLLFECFTEYHNSIKGHQIDKIEIFKLVHKINPILAEQFTQQLRSYYSYDYDTFKELFFNLEVDILAKSSETEKSRYLYLHINAKDLTMEDYEALLKNRREIKGIYSTKQSATIITVLKKMEKLLEENLLLNDDKATFKVTEIRGTVPVIFVAINTQRNEEIIKDLIIYGVQLDGTSYAGETPLHRAAELGMDAVIQRIAKKGIVSVNAKDNDGLTPLDHAELNSKPHACKALKLLGGTTGSKFNLMKRKKKLDYYDHYYRNYSDVSIRMNALYAAISALGVAFFAAVRSSGKT